MKELEDILDDREKRVKKPKEFIKNIYKLDINDDDDDCDCCYYEDCYYDCGDCDYYDEEGDLDE